MQLTLISYLAPSVPADFFRAVADEIRSSCGIVTHLLFDSRISGPLEGDDDPLSQGMADIAFVCSPSFRFLRNRGAELLPVAVPADPRAQGRPVYFSDVIVPVASLAQDTAGLAHEEWVCNDSHSLSGYFAIRDHFAALGSSGPRYRFTGSHLQSLAEVAAGTAAAAAIDSNVLLRELRRSPELQQKVRVIDSWGPRPMQPAVARGGLDRSLRNAVAEALVGIQESRIREYGFRGFATSDESSYLK